MQYGQAPANILASLEVRPSIVSLVNAFSAENLMSRVARNFCYRQFRSMYGFEFVERNFHEQTCLFTTGLGGRVEMEFATKLTINVLMLKRALYAGCLYAKGATGNVKPGSSEKN